MNRDKLKILAFGAYLLIWNPLIAGLVGAEIGEHFFDSPEWGAGVGIATSWPGFLLTYAIWKRSLTPEERQAINNAADELESRN